MKMGNNMRRVVVMIQVNLRIYQSKPDVHSLPFFIVVFSYFHRSLKWMVALNGSVCKRLCTFFNQMNYSMRKLVLSAPLLLLCCSLLSQVLSPEQFLGYRLGSRYTPHYNIVNYFRHVSEKVPEMVKLEQYGTTNEGRPLLLAYVASRDNLNNLENIRQNNLRLAGMTADKMAPNENAPAILWLSYNVHGNETSSSEAALLTLFELVNPS